MRALLTTDAIINLTLWNNFDFCYWIYRTIWSFLSHSNNNLISRPRFQIDSKSSMEMTARMVMTKFNAIRSITIQLTYWTYLNGLSHVSCDVNIVPYHSFQLTSSIILLIKIKPLMCCVFAILICERRSRW